MTTVGELIINLKKFSPEQEILYLDKGNYQFQKCKIGVAENKIGRRKPVLFLGIIEEI